MNIAYTLVKDETCGLVILKLGERVMATFTLPEWSYLISHPEVIREETSATDAADVPNDVA